MSYIKKFEDVRLADTPLVGGKNSSLGEMIGQLSSRGIRVPTGFAVTAQAYWYFVEYNQLIEPMKQAMATLTDCTNFEHLHQVGTRIRTLMAQGKLPADLAHEVTRAYDDLCRHYHCAECDVAVRSSATAEDLPTASFAGQQETFLNVRGHAAVLDAVQKSMISLFTDRAIAYRAEKGFDHFKVGLSVGIQKMIRSDLAVSGVMFTLDTESGFRDAVVINSSYGLGEAIVKGEVVPDEFVVHKPTMEQGFVPIIRKLCGTKLNKIVYAQGQATTTVAVPESEQHHFSLPQSEIMELARAAVVIENHYSQLRGSWCPMDIEWAKDGQDGKLYILQARPETVHAVMHGKGCITRSTLKPTMPPQILISGQSIGQHIAVGPVRVIMSAENIDLVQKGDVLVTDMTDPDWMPAMKKAAGIITNRGGRTCHAAIVSRELNIPAVVGAQGATEVVRDGQQVTIDCSQGKTGFVYEGIVPFECQELTAGELTTAQAPVKVMVNIADPERALVVAQLPNDGVGLARLEFIITNVIQAHPRALLHPEKIKDTQSAEKIAALTSAYTDKVEFFVDTLACGVGTIAAAFWPKHVIVRFSDFKTNEYRNLVGGIYFEPEEENPMLGFRGASRYYSDAYKDAFALECAALKKVRDVMGLVNVQVMLPFVRTTTEAQRVLEVMRECGLERGKNGLEVIMMCEIPSNVLLLEEFAQLFDGFSIGSNDLTQLTLGVDRDAGTLAHLFDERDPAVQKMLSMAISSARKCKKNIGICGQAPSDMPEIAQFLIEHGITSISLNADSLVPFLMRYR
jgi:pyruvate, water dikinase